MNSEDKGRDMTASQAKAEFIAPSYALKAKAPLRDLDLAAVVAQAVLGLKDLQPDYRAVLEEECRALYAAGADVEDTGGGPIAVARLSRMAHQIRGHSGTIGFAAVCRVCDSLCGFLTGRDTLSAKEVEVARLHLDALLVVLQHTDDRQFDGRFDAVFGELEKVVHKFEGT
ncbi:Hpt domain-containing protein [Shumkonia mesophila]|uniref:Hpt domain-containing protein n=1 Tax=Shumkonia mesophila TaxID=2838854 RepID=UPI002934BB8F|nr:Hpt domain-containing protein [Shumkonia mesophila]